MKKLLLLIPLAFLSIPAPIQAQQVNVYQGCIAESYYPAHYDRYGNFVRDSVIRNFVPCGGGYSAGNYYQQPQRICNPTAGAAMGAGLAEALSGGNGWRSNSNWTRDYNRNSSSGSYNYSSRNYTSNGWSLFGAGLGALMYSC
jgi:hypothetical protein